MSGNRKITREVCSAFVSGRSKSVSNTCTDGKVLLLHGNKIAEHREDGIYITLAGWNSPTTRERLNYFAQIHTKQGQAFLNGEKWDGNWIKLS